MITSVDLKGEEIPKNAFITVESNKALSGNAVVAVKFDGVIKYSWHIWVVDYDPDERYHSLSGNILMSRNIGAISEEPVKSTDTYGVYYQWGRKDPFPTAERNTSGGKPKPMYDKDGNEVTVSVFTHPFAITEILENPTTVPDQLDASGGYDSWVTDEETKGLLDPCPAGRRVPDNKNGINPWDGFNEHSTYKNNGLITSDGIWYPFPGKCYFPTKKLPSDIIQQVALDITGLVTLWWFSQRQLYNKCFWSHYKFRLYSARSSHSMHERIIHS